MTAPLPLPDDDRTRRFLAESWPDWHFAHPRSAWLHDFEAILREHYPQASSDELPTQRRERSRRRHPRPTRCKPACRL